MGRLPPSGTSLPGLTRKPSADLDPNLMGLRCLWHSISIVAAIWCRRHQVLRLDPSTAHSRVSGNPESSSVAAGSPLSRGRAGESEAIRLEKAPTPAPLPAPLAPLPRPSDLTLDRSRDDLLTDFGKATLNDRYLLAGESYQDMFARVAMRLSPTTSRTRSGSTTAMSRLWFMPATPVLSNGGTTRGLPISCFLNSVPDSLDGIVDTWNENVWLASNGGGIGTYWGRVRSIGEKVKGAARPPASFRSST